MLEDFATRLLTMGERTLTLVFIAAMVVGFLLALAFRRGQRTVMTRAPYFLCIALLYFLTVLAAAPFLFVFEAMQAGLMWALVAGTLVLIALIGFGFGELALARSRDAYGNNNSAILGIIPFANLILMFKASKTPGPKRWGRASLVVLSGILVLILAAAAQVVLDRLLASLEKDVQPQDEVALIETLVQRQGLQEALKQMAQGDVAVSIDEVTTLARIEADGPILRRTYVVKADLPYLSSDFKAGIMRSICEHPPLVAGRLSKRFTCGKMAPKSAIKA